MNTLTVDFMKNEITQEVSPALIDVGEIKARDARLQRYCEACFTRPKFNNFVMHLRDSACKFDDVAKENTCKGVTPVNDKAGTYDIDCVASTEFKPADCEIKARTVLDSEALAKAKEAQFPQQHADIGMGRKGYFTVTFNYLINYVQLSGGKCRRRRKQSHIKNLKYGIKDIPEFCIPKVPIPILKPEVKKTNRNRNLQMEDIFDTDNSVGIELDSIPDSNTQDVDINDMT